MIFAFIVIKTLLVILKENQKVKLKFLDQLVIWTIEGYSKGSEAQNKWQNLKGKFYYKDKCCNQILRYAIGIYYK